MGKAKTWTPEEHAALAQAWINASEDKDGKKVNGTNQDSATFFNKAFANMKPLAPPHEDLNGKYHNRGSSALQRHWKDDIAREVKKFNRALLKVFSSNPTGCGDEEKISMAAAIHLGKTDKMQYTLRSFEVNEWKFYRAWLILKDHKLFQPPKPKEAIEIPDEVELEETIMESPEDGSDDQGNTNSSDDATVTLTTPVTLFASAS